MSNRPPLDPADRPGDSDDATEMLPSWLQSFGDTVAADGPPAQEASSLSSLPRPSSGLLPSDEAAGANLPGWLDEAAAAPTRASSNAKSSPIAERRQRSEDSDSASVDDATGFFSDDDLPEWLRSLGPATPAAPGVSGTAAHAPEVATVSTATVSVPAVARVWVTPHEAAPVPQSASLFANIAGAINQRPDSGVPEMPGNSASPLATMPLEQPLSGSATVIKVNRPRAGRWSRKILWLVVLFIILAVVMLWILLQLQA